LPRAIRNSARQIAAWKIKAPKGLRCHVHPLHRWIGKIIDRLQVEIAGQEYRDTISTRRILN
jgi:hypothetical protein